MFLFAHLGITLGTAVIVAGITDTAPKEVSANDAEADGKNNSAVRRLNSLAATIGSWLQAFSRKVDVRAILISASPPGFVYAIIGSYFIFFNSFAVNMVLQYKQVGPWKDYLFGEKVYIMLSLSAKSLLAWLVFANILVQ